MKNLISFGSATLANGFTIPFNCVRICSNSECIIMTNEIMLQNRTETTTVAWQQRPTNRGKRKKHMVTRRYLIMKGPLSIRFGSACCIPIPFVKINERCKLVWCVEECTTRTRHPTESSRRAKGQNIHNNYLVRSNAYERRQDKLICVPLLCV